MRRYSLKLFAVLLPLVSSFTLAADESPVAIPWPAGAEALIDKAIEIKVKAQKQNLQMFSEGGEHGHAFAKCLDELAQILSGESLNLEQLKEKEGSDLKAKIALWSLDRKVRSEEYARLEHCHISDNPIGKAAAERKSVQDQQGNEGVTFLPDGQPRRFPQPQVSSAPMVADDDAVEGNRWILEYLYFAPPTGKREWQMSNRSQLIIALTRICNEKSLVMLKFDLEVQFEASSGANNEEIGAYARYILDFRTRRAFTIVASMIHHDGVRRNVRDLISYLSRIHPEDVQNLYYSKLQDYRKLANMEWQTDAEKELASWMKEIPLIPASNPPLDGH
ncbi:MAG: hypothetical protein V4689_11650 [Verrucomicrobiota bacterium]